MSVGQAMEFLAEHAEMFKLRKILPVSVSGAFHTDLMKPAAKAFKEMLDETELHEPSAFTYSNVDSKPYRTLEHVRKKLPKQIYKPVLWEQLLQRMYKRDPGVRFPSTFVCGPKGESLVSIVKRVNYKAGQFCTPI